MRKIVVTGGYGFIASHFIKMWMQKYPQDVIINVDKLTYAANIQNLDGVVNCDKYHFYQENIIWTDYMRVHCCDADVIVHFAAESHVDNSINASQIFIQTNINGTYSLLEACKDNKKLQLFVQISTDEVYGSGGPFTETAILNPSSPYSASKAAAEMLCLAYEKTYKIPLLITRSGNNYGSHQHSEKLIPKTILNLIQNKKVPIYGTGLNERSWIHVCDNCEAIMFLIERNQHGIFNIGVEESVSNLDLMTMIFNIMNKDEKLIEFVQDRLAHDFTYKLDTAKIRMLGWKPQCSFQEGLVKTVKWYESSYFSGR